MLPLFISRINNFILQLFLLQLEHLGLFHVILWVRHVVHVFPWIDVRLIFLFNDFFDELIGVITLHLSIIISYEYSLLRGILNSWIHVLDIDHHSSWLRKWRFLLLSLLLLSLVKQIDWNFPKHRIDDKLFLSLPIKVFQLIDNFFIHRTGAGILLVWFTLFQIKLFDNSLCSFRIVPFKGVDGGVTIAFTESLFLVLWLLSFISRDHCIDYISRFLDHELITILFFLFFSFFQCYRRFVIRSLLGFWASSLFTIFFICNEIYLF